VNAKAGHFRISVSLRVCCRHPVTLHFGLREFSGKCPPPRIPAVPATTAPELIGYAKANPGKIRLALTDPGSAPHASGELFRMMTGIDLALVRYPGEPAALKGAIEGRSDLMFEPLSASLPSFPHPRAGEGREGQQAARPGGDRHDAFAGAPGPSNARRFRARL